MKGKKQKVGVIPKELLFQVEKPRHEVRFRTGRHMTEKDRPRDRSYKKWSV